MSESIPPLRVSLNDGTASQIPVFELQFSGGTLSKLSPTKVLYTPDLATTDTSAIVYAPTGGNYVSFAADVALSAEKVLTAGTNVSITTDANAIYVSADTGAAATQKVYAATAGYFVMAETNDANLTNAKLIKDGNSTTIRTDGGAIYIDAVTGGGGAVYAATGAYYIMAETNDANMTVAKLLLSGTGASIRTDGGATYVDVVTQNILGKVNTDTTIVVYYPISGGGSLNTSRTLSIDTAFLANTGSNYFAGTGLGFVTWKSEAGLTGEKVLSAGSSVVIHTDATSVYIDATTSTNVSNVTTGSSQYLGFYKAADNSIYPSHVSESTGTGVALWNVPLLATDPGSSANGDVWFLSSGGVVYLRVNTNNTIVTLTFS